MLIPPPPAPSLGRSFQTTSLVTSPPEIRSDVPPQPSACGAEAGKSTCCLPSVTPSVDPPSPAATVTVTPSAAPSVRICSICIRACSVQESSGPPQLIDTTLGLLVVSCTAVETASMKPWSVLGEKYTT